MTCVNHNFNITDNDKGGHRIRCFRNGKNTQVSSSATVDKWSPEMVIKASEILGCTPAALAKALDEYNDPEREKRKSSSATSKALLKVPRACMCGCGGTIYSKNIKTRFMQGHDAKLHSRLLKEFRNPTGSKESRDEAETKLKELGWL